MSPNEYRKLTDEAKAEAWSRLSEDEKRAIREQESEGPVPANQGGGHAGVSGGASTSPQEHLAQIRGNTCYTTLRAVIDIYFWLQLGVVTIAWLILGVGMVRGEAPIPGLLLLAAYPLFLALAVAAKQGAMLLVDIADCLVHQGSRKG